MIILLYNTVGCFLFTKKVTKVALFNKASFFFIDNICDEYLLYDKILAKAQITLSLINAYLNE